MAKYELKRIYPNSSIMTRIIHCDLIDVSENSISFKKKKPNVDNYYTFLVVSLFNVYSCELMEEEEL